MEPSVYRIVYCSHNLIPPQQSGSGQDRELRQILDASRKNNSADDVTGALLFNQEYFAQVLEGPRSSVERAFERIQRDRRHGQVTVVDNGFAEHRDFPEWAMAHAEPASSQQAEGIAAALHLALLQPSEKGADVLDLLKGLVAQD